LLDKALAIGILIFTLGLIMTEKVHRTVAAIIGAMCVMVSGLVGPEDIIDPHGPIHWEALGLIFGMFVMIAVLRKVGFFRWVGLRVLMMAKFKIFRVFILFSILSAFLAAFMDCITVLLFMASLTMEISKILKVSPIPLIMGEITSANIGGSSTMVGGPPNIIIGTALDYSFIDFVTNTGPIAVVCFCANLLFFYLYYRKYLTDTEVDSAEFYRVYKYMKPPPETAIKDMRTLKIAFGCFLFSIILLVFHHHLHLSVAFIGILGAVLTILIGGGKLPEMMDRIDWRTILFFAGLFVVVGGLEKTGVTTDIASGIGNATGGNLMLTITVLLWLAAFLSAFVDNVPVAATMVPILRDLSVTTGMDLSTLAWTTCLACDIGGNATPIGGSANVVGLSVEEKWGVHESWFEYCRAAVPATVICMVICNILLIIKYAI
jgi:Na+/H+ antiporter NhaD/arsenite permease-like protein